MQIYLVGAHRSQICKLFIKVLFTCLLQCYPADTTDAFSLYFGSNFRENESEMLDVNQIKHSLIFNYLLKNILSMKAE